MPIFEDEYYKQFGELDICPCCGAPAEWRGGSSTSDYIKCTKCCLKYSGGWNRQKLADGWNRRIERACKLIIKDNMNETEGYGDVWLECSACHSVLAYPEDINVNYCPCCGAKVIKDEKTGTF